VTTAFSRQSHTRGSNQLRVLWRARASLVVGLAETWWRRPAGPTRVVLDVTRRCNLRCAMCRTWERARADELAAGEIAAVLGRLDRLRWLDVTGGEPFVRADIGELLDAIAASTPTLEMLHFQTNGWSTDRIVRCTERLRARTRAELIVTVSIDGPARLHDRIRGVPGSFARAVTTAAALRELPGVEVHIGTTITALNADAMASTWDALQVALPQWPRLRWHWNAMQLSTHFFANAAQAELQVPVDRLVRGHLRARGLPRTMIDAMESAYLINLAFVARGEPSRIPCQALRSALFLSPEGDVMPCHIYDRPLGNVRERDVLAIWHDAATLGARADIERLACGGCFSACEAYPALAGAPLQAIAQTVGRALRLARERLVARRSSDG
jgi:Fe-coproporphyrin III synthase